MNKIFRLILTILLVSTLTGCGELLATTAVVGGIGTGVYVSQDRRSTGAFIDDKSIQVQALSSILSDSTIRKHSNISVTSYNALVLITGQTVNDEIKDQIQDIVSKIKNVRKVYNEVTIDEPLSLKERAKDALITTKVKSSMFARIKELNPARIKVVTENKIVYLMGIVSAEEARLAAEVARSTDGVTSVVKILEPYTEEKK